MLLVYMTASDHDEALRITKYVVEERLAAGGNVFAPMQSIYHWKGNIECATECACLLKTTKENFLKLKEAIVRLHSYETPCIIAIPVHEAEAAFGAWVKQECL